MGTEQAFRDLATWAEGTSPLYARLARGVADDPVVLEIADRAPEDRSKPHLLLAAVHDLLLADHDHDLAAYYPSVVAASDGIEAGRDPDDDLAEQFRWFVVTHEGAILERLENRRTQTNSVRRAGALYPAIARATMDADAPLAILEVGPSAGLNLLFDRYAYVYDRPDDDSTPRRVGDADSPVTIHTELRSGDPPLPRDPPPVACRIGVDLHPLDVADPADRRWVRALAWPDHVDRHRLLADALAVAAADPPRLVEGDAVDRLPDLVAEVPGDVPVLVVDTLVRYQLPDDVHDAYCETIADLGADRKLYWLSGYGHSDAYEHGIDLWFSEVGAGDPERIGVFEGHGRWLRWDG